MSDGDGFLKRFLQKIMFWKWKNKKCRVFIENEFVLGLYNLHEKDDEVTGKDYLRVYGTIKLELIINININNFIEGGFLSVKKGSWILKGRRFGFNYVSKLTIKCVKVYELKILLYL